ncbi:MAG TPA: trehalose-phosphatase [Steroidobacteraceae bacterium]
MSSVTATRAAGDWALFLDVDGTLLEIAETPESVRVPPDLKKLLSEASLRLQGAIALVSGRTIADLDRLFAPLTLCAAGVHGCERRNPDGSIVLPEVSPELLVPVRQELGLFAARHPGVVVEDKGYGVALHFRRAPELAGDALALMRALCRQLSPRFTLQSGKCVVEIRPTGFTKGTSILAFMQLPPFAGRTPLFIGDDLTDEDGFAVVNELGGISIKVGDSPSTLAQRRIPTVRDVWTWLENLSVGDTREATGDS